MAFANVVQLRAQGEQRCRGLALMGMAKRLGHAGHTVAMAIEFATGLLRQCPELAVFRTGRQICRGAERACGCHARQCA
ncbi:hypothetical protein APE01nite_20410 [Acetobacter peroxydans]|uniref:Uncharacterized protein n=1 Tax=Acetobacter peroxydans TaxID=104098 RepID=A0A4Y3TWV6_9PROT|nr:hypothetical protein AA13755_0512 [Acetobacter peroxydans NBRC 13755]GEB86244.1 hypothetical protein APE01nite_20410 [Acetobacter peroxydans]